MHITLVIPDLKGGGAERMVLNLAQGLIDRGHGIDIVLMRPLLDYVEEVPDDARLFYVDPVRGRSTIRDVASPSARLQHLSQSAGGVNWLDTARAFDWDLLRCRPDLKLLNRARAIASYIARETPDCVLPSLPRAKAATLMAARFLPEHPPIVPIVHNNYERRRPRDRNRLRHLAPHAAHFVGVSRGAAERLAAVVGVPQERITTIYNPVVTPALRKGAADPAPHPWLRDSATPVVLSAGRLEKAKDFPTLIKAFARLATRRPCRLIILGEGKQRENLQGLVHKLELDDRVVLPGWVDNPFAYMARASVFVVSSTYEGLSMVLVEALACGCPSVSTDCPSGPAEVLRDGKLGALVAVGDEDGLAKAVEQVLDDPPEKRVLQRRAEDFSVNVAATAYERLIRTLVAGAQDRPDPREGTDAHRGLRGE
ncbi:MAG: glycosyltransferase [Deltaproteobacteria bacterium]|nr:glycosyltransferase [Deltaproteobacteria bacterium]